MWWCTPIIPAFQEAEIELLESKSSRLWCIMIIPVISSLGNIARPQLLKKKKTVLRGKFIPLNRSIIQLVHSEYNAVKVETSEDEDPYIHLEI